MNVERLGLRGTYRQIYEFILKQPFSSEKGTVEIGEK